MTREGAYLLVGSRNAWLVCSLEGRVQRELLVRVIVKLEGVGDARARARERGAGLTQLGSKLASYTIPRACQHTFA